MNVHGGYHGDKLIKDYSVNINPLGMPDWVRRTISDSVLNLYKYPEIDGQSVIREIAKWSSRDPEEVILGNGAIELIYLAVRSHQWKNALIVEPTFNEYRRALEMYDVTCKSYVLTRDNDFSLNVECLKEQLADTIDVLFICNPNNPTGNGYDYQTMSKLLLACREKKIDLVVDESFIDFTAIEALDALVADNRLLLLRSMTKSYGLPGLRMGYALGHPSMIRTMKHFKEPWTQNYYALTLMPQLLNDHEHIRRTVAFIKERVHEVNEYPWVTWHSQAKANFFLLHLGDKHSDDLNEYLMTKGYFVRTCHDFIGLDEHYVRITLKDNASNHELFDYINNFIKGEI